MQGWIKLHRKILDNPIICKDSDYFSVWCYLLLNATHDKYDSVFKGERISLAPGQLITGRQSIAKQFNLTESKVQRILKKLEIEQQIEQQTSNANRLITVLNWNEYQSSEQQIEQPVNNERTTNEQPVNTNKNVNNDNNEKNKYKDVYDYYLTKNLVRHRQYTKDMTDAMKRAEKQLGLDTDYMKRIIDRHEQKVLNTAKSEYKTKVRPLAELFGQKKYNSTSLICVDYLDENYQEQRNMNLLDTKDKVVQPTEVVRIRPCNTLETYQLPHTQG